MNKGISLLLVFIFLLTGCSQPQSVTQTNLPTVAATLPQSISQPEIQDPAPGFTDLGNPALLRYVEDSVYAELVSDLNSEEYFVENVSAIYISKEYLEELAYNSQANVYFGYTLAELEGQFQGTKFIFTLGEDGQTAVKEFENYDDTYSKVIKNVATGAGVILICVTVSTLTAGAGAPAVAMIFAASAKTGTAVALSNGLFSGVASGVVTGIQTKDFDQAVKSAALSGSEGFKWGAIGGAVAGGASKASALYGASRNGLTMNQAAAIQKESKMPLDVIKQFRTMDQYNIAKAAGLKTKMIGGRTALVRKIDLNYIDEFGRTNLERMRQKLAALDPNGVPYELHHIGQEADATLAILTKAEHMQGGNNKIWHIFGKASKVDHGAVWTKTRGEFWKELADVLASGGI